MYSRSRPLLIPAEMSFFTLHVVGEIKQCYLLLSSFLHFGKLFDEFLLECVGGKFCKQCSTLVLVSINKLEKQNNYLNRYT